MGGDEKKDENTTLKRSQSTASTVPGDNAKAQQMAAENNAQRLKEIRQYQDQRRHGKPLPTPQDSKDTLILGGSETENLRKLRRVGSSPILHPKPDASKTVKPAPAETTKTTANKKGKKKLRKRGKKVIKNTKKRSAAKIAKRSQLKKDHASKSNGIARKPTPPAAPASAAEQKAQVSEEAEKALPAAQPQTSKPSQVLVVAPPVAVKFEPAPHTPDPEEEWQVAPVATPARAPGAPPTGDAVRDLLNRATTQEQLQHTPPGTLAVTSGVPGTSQPPESEEKHTRKPRDKARHARRQKFYRSLDSHCPSQPKHQSIFCLCVYACKSACQLILTVFSHITVHQNSNS